MTVHIQNSPMHAIVLCEWHLFVVFVIVGIHWGDWEAA